MRPLTIAHISSDQHRRSATSSAPSALRGGGHHEPVRCRHSLSHDLLPPSRGRGRRPPVTRVLRHWLLSALSPRLHTPSSALSLGAHPWGLFRSMFVPCVTPWGLITHSRICCDLPLPLPMLRRPSASSFRPAPRRPPLSNSALRFQPPLGLVLLLRLPRLCQLREHVPRLCSRSSQAVILHSHIFLSPSFSMVPRCFFLQNAHP